MQLKKNTSGFTLTEILIVLVIAGILLALILPNSVKAITKGEAVSKLSNVDSCNAALVQCYGEKQKWSDCDTLGELTSGGFTKADIPHVTIVADGAGYTCN